MRPTEGDEWIETTHLDSSVRSFESNMATLRVERRFALAMYRPEQYVPMPSFGEAAEPAAPVDDMAELMRQQRIGLALIIAFLVTAGIGIAQWVGLL